MKFNACCTYVKILAVVIIIILTVFYWEAVNQMVPSERARTLTNIRCGPDGWRVVT